MAERNDGFRQFDKERDFCWDSRSSESAKITNYAVCFTPRSGSHYLGHLMYATGAMGYPLEYFHPDHFRKWTELSGQTDALKVIEYIRSRRTSPNGCFGFKAHFALFAHTVREYRFDQIFPHCRFVLIEREDTLGQAISLVRAEQTNQWISMHEPLAKATYDFDAIERAAIRVLEDSASWHRFFALTGWNHLRVTYEELIADSGKTILKIAEYLETGPAGNDTAAVAMPQKQADAESREWRNRFLNDPRARSLDYSCIPLRLQLP